MEVTTMPSSPASTTEGDSLCETDVTDVAIHSVTLLICLCGLAGNGTVIGLLSLKRRNACFFNMAVIDFIFLLFGVPSALLFLVEDVSCSPILPLMYLNFLLQLSVVSCYWGLFRVMHGSILDLIDSLFCLCCHWQLPLRLRWVMDSAQYWAFFALFAVIPSVTFLCPAQQQEHCQAAFISVYSLILLLFVAPMVISSTVDFIRAKWGSQQQQRERSNIVIFPIVLFTFLYTICNFLQDLGYLTVPSQVVFLLACINSSIKPFIYFLMGRCRIPCSMQPLRLSVQRVFEEPKENPADGDSPAMDMGV